MNFEKLLVATKFSPPRIGARYIVRKQLLDVLQRERSRKLILVPGSAGFGKTILLAQWRQDLLKEGLQVVWLSLGPDERLLPNFSAHLFAALAKLGMPVEEELPLGDDRGRATDAIVAAVVNHLSGMDEDVYLILDDYHYVEDPSAHRLLQKLVELSPDNLHVVIASRSAPPLSVARLRVMGQVGEIDCGDLPFDASETRAFLEQNIAGGVRVDEAEQIHELTNGWPACLQLVAIMLKNRPERRALLHDLAWQSADLQNYLTEDVLDRLPAELVAFMEEVSICRRFNAAVAEAVTGRSDAEALLRRIEEENLLIARVDVDDRAPWYRFHPLFAEFLSVRLQRRGQPTMDQLHRRACAWCSEKGLVVEAMRHAGLGHDLEAAVEVFERAAPASWRLSHFGPMLHLLNNLPPETVTAHPRLLVMASLTTGLTGRLSRAAVWLDQVRSSGLVDRPGGPFRVALLEAVLAFQRDDSARAFELLRGFCASDARTTLERYAFVSILGFSLAAEGHYSEAARLLLENSAPASERNEDLPLISESCAVSWTIMQGRMRDAERTGSAVYARAVATHGRRSVCASLIGVGVLVAYLELNRIDEARELLANSTTRLTTYPAHTMISAYLARAQLAQALESPLAAMAELDEQEALFQSMGLDRGVAHVLAEKVSIHLREGRPDLAAQTATRLDELARQHSGAGGFRGEIGLLARMAQGRRDLAAGEPAAAAAFREAGDTARALGRGQASIAADLLLAMSLDAGGDSAEAEGVLAAVLERAAPMGLVRTFLSEGPDALALLGRLQGQDKLSPATQAFVGELLAAAAPVAASEPADLEGARTGTPLTRREEEIIVLLSAGMSNKRIALTLNIALDTVKWNLKKVFAKLGVTNRYDAMRWARRHGLAS